jgi:hypothetical protein
LKPQSKTYFKTFNINKIQTNPAFQINKIQTENLTLREISDAFDKEYKNENLNTNEK